MTDGPGLRERVRIAREYAHVEWEPGSAGHPLERMRARARRQQLARGGGAVIALAAAAALVFFLTRPADPAPIAGRDAPSRETTPAADGVLRFADGSVATPIDGAELVVLHVRPDETRLSLRRGGARFEVTPGLPRAFVVEAGEVSVHVVGTVFTVERDGPEVDVAVTHGRVRVEWADGHAYVAVGEQGRFPVPRPAEPEGAPSDPESAAATEPTEPTEAAAEPARPRPPRETPEPTETAEAPEPPPSGWRAMAAEGRYDEGYGPLLADVSVLRTGDVETLLLAADVARLSGHPGQSLPYLRRALSVGRGDPREQMVAFTLGRVLQGQPGRAREAAETYARARAIDPEGSLAADALAREVQSWSQAGDGARARERALEYLRLYPEGIGAGAVRRHGGLE